MSKCTRHQPDFYASLFDDISARGLSYKGWVLDTHPVHPPPGLRWWPLVGRILINFEFKRRRA